MHVLYVDNIIFSNANPHWLLLTHDLCPKGSMVGSYMVKRIVMRLFCLLNDLLNSWTMQFFRFIYVYSVRCTYVRDQKWNEIEKFRRQKAQNSSPHFIIT